MLTACGGGDGGGCDPAPHVLVQYFGDSTAVQLQPEVGLQQILDAKFGAGIVTVENRGSAGSQTEWLIVGGDHVNLPWPQSTTGQIVVLNHGINDMLRGVSLEQYRANLLILAPRVTLWQTPIRGTRMPLQADAFAQVMREVAAGTDVADVAAYSHDWGIGMLEDGQHARPEGYAAITRDVLAPLVIDQVRALRCEP